MAFILGVGSYSSDTRGPFLMKLWGCIELTLTFCIVDFFTSGRMSKPEVGFPHTISVLFRYEILPADRENDLESNELCINIGETGNTGENRKWAFPIRYRYYFGTKFHLIIEKTIWNLMSYGII